MGPSAYWARAELHRRGHGIVAVALLVALACAAPTAAAAGARRTGSVVDRMAQELRPGDVSLQVEALDPPTLATIRALPGVELAAVRSTIFLRPSGTDLQPFAEFFAVGSADGVSGYDIVRPRVERGRLPARDASDEVLVTRTLADRLGVGVGDELSVDTLTLDAVFASFETGGIPAPDGPVIELIVTGIGELGGELVAPGRIPYGSMFFGPAFLERYDDVAAFSDIVDVELAGGTASVDRFVDAARDALGDENVFITPVADELDQVRDGVALQRMALLLFLAVAAAAGAVAVAQAASRTAARHEADLDTLDAVGLGISQRVAAISLAFLPAVLLGTLLGLCGATLASRWLPFGLAGRLEPDPGVGVDIGVFSIGAVLTVGTAMLAIAASTALADARRRRRPASRREPSWVTRTAGWAPPAAAIGIRWALVPARGRSATPVRSGLAGTALGIGGALAALHFGGSLDRLMDTPERYGVSHDLQVAPVGDEASDDEARAAVVDLADHEAVEAVALVRVAKLSFSGQTHDAFGVEGDGRNVGLLVSEGRVPESDAEVTVGDELLDELELEVGDVLRLEGSDRPLTIVGRGLFPPLDDGNSLATGVGFTLRGLEAALEDLGDARSSSGYPVALVDVAPGLDPALVRRSLAAEFGDARLATRPTSVDNLGEAEGVPTLVAGFLGLLGALALGHGVVASSQRRRSDLAVLRCLGFVRSDLALTVGAHSATLVGVGILVGVPVGAAVGRRLWQVVAADLGVGTAPVSVAATAAVVVATGVAVGFVLAVPAGRAAGRTHPATVLRAE